MIFIYEKDNLSESFDLELKIDPVLEHEIQT